MSTTAHIIGPALIKRAAKAGACASALAWARETPRTLDDLMEHTDWAWWAMHHLCSAKAQRAYDAAMAKALRVYYAAEAKAQRAYKAATAEALRVYHAAEAKAQRAALLTLWGTP